MLVVLLQYQVPRVSHCSFELASSHDCAHKFTSSILEEVAVTQDGTPFKTSDTVIIDPFLVALPLVAYTCISHPSNGSIKAKLFIET